MTIIGVGAVFAGLAGFLLGASVLGLAWFLRTVRTRRKIGRMQRLVEESDNRAKAQAEENTKLNSRMQRLEERGETLLVQLAKAEAEIEMSGKVRQDFSSIASEALIGKMENLDNILKDMERSRIASQASVFEQIKNVNEGHRQLQDATGRLSSALSNPRTRGKWGELQLKNVLDMSGLNELSDYTLQKAAEQGRPDVVVNLGNGKLAIDAKTPMDAYLAMTEDEAPDKLEEPDVRGILPVSKAGLRGEAGEPRNRGKRSFPRL